MPNDLQDWRPECRGDWAYLQLNWLGLCWWSRIQILLSLTTTYTMLLLVAVSLMSYAIRVTCMVLFWNVESAYSIRWDVFTSVRHAKNASLLRWEVGFLGTWAQCPSTWTRVSDFLFLRFCLYIDTLDSDSVCSSSSYVLLFCLTLLPDPYVRR